MKYLLSVLLCIVCSTTVVAGTLFYDSVSGDVFINVDYEKHDDFIGISLRSGETRFRPDNYQRLGDQSALYYVSDRVIYEARLTGRSGRYPGYPNGLYELGAILPAGLSEHDFNDFGIEASWGAIGQIKPIGFAIAFERPNGIPFNSGLSKLNWADSALLSYNADNGEVILNTDGDAGGYVTSFSVNAIAAGILLTDNAIKPAEQSHMAITDGGVGLHGVGILSPGQYNLGAILPSDLSASELRNILHSVSMTTTTNVGSVDIAVAGLDDISIAILWVPEPSAVVLGALVLVICLHVTRRSAPGHFLSRTC